MTAQHFPQASDYPNATDATGPVVVCRDGKRISKVMDAGHAFGWLLNHQGQSVSYALMYGGYSVRSATAEEIAS
jgi:hypothetical protein